MPIFLVAGTMLAFLWKFNADDAYIVGRYAINAAAGHGLVYNQGEYVSALTSPLHALIASAFAWGGLQPVGAYRVIIPFVLVAAMLHAARMISLAGSEKRFFYTFSMTSPYLLIWVVGGLETPLLAGWLTWFAAIYLRFYRQVRLTNKELVAAGVLVGLAFLTRHDSIIVMGPLYMAVLVSHRGRAAAWLGVVCCGALAATWLVFAYRYYGDVLPTSAYLKLVNAERGTAWHLGSIVNFVVVSGLFVLVPLVMLPPKEPLQRGVAHLFLVLAIAAGVFYALKTAGAHMFFSYRAFAPYIPALGLMMLPVARRFPLSATTISVVANIGGFLSMCFVGLTPVVVRALPVVGPLPVEYTRRTFFDYAEMQAALRKDAIDLRAHWQAQSNDHPPTIFLYTGGMGYWLPEFHVFEALVDFRKNCPNAMQEKLSAANYVQDLSSIHVNHEVQTLWRGAHSGEMTGPLSATPVQIEGQATLQYWYAPDVTAFRFPAKIGDKCN